MRRRAFRVVGGRRAGVLLAVVAALAGATAAPARGRPATFADLAVGRVVAVEARTIGPRTLVAEEIEIQPDGAREVKVRGIVETADPAARTLVVLGIRVAAAADAKVEDSERRPVPISALRPGVKIKVEGTLAGRAIRATRLKISKHERHDSADLEGPIEAVDQAQRVLTLLGVPVRVAPHAKITFDSRYASQR